MSDIQAIQNCAGIILAAGSSRRLGMPKQQLMFRGKTLLQHTIDEALLAGLSPLIVVTDSTDLYNQFLLQKNVIHVVNNDAAEGMAASIRCGIKALECADAAILLVCDQPLLHAEILKQLIKKQIENSVAIVASAYQQVIGTPVLFHSSLFTALLQLKGDTGAKKILDIYKNSLATVAFEDGELDIDSAADYAQLKKREQE